MTARGRDRVLGPYQESDGWRVISIDASGQRESVKYDSEAKAQRYADTLRAALSREDHTTATAWLEYEKHLLAKGTQPQSIDVTKWAIESFFVEPHSLRALTAKKCGELYEAYRTTPTKRTLKPPANDTHRNTLSQVKSFLAWCAKRGWIRANPAVDVQGIGKRRPRGKSLGKEGNTLRVREARAWYGKALELGAAGDQGAIAALVALMLGLRASEIVSRKVGDLDEDAAPCDLLWIPCSKTPAGRRTLEVPSPLSEMLAATIAGKARERYVFECERKHELGKGKPHKRDWIIDQVHRICGLAKVPEVTAHAMRGLLATISAERGLAGHLIAATLGHEDQRTTMTAYAAPGADAAGANRRGLVVLNGGAKRTG